MNTTAAAVQANVTVVTIRTWCRKGVIAATKAAGRWVIDTASLARRITIGAMRTTTPRKETPMTQHTPATSAQVSYAMKLLAELADSDFGLEFYQGPTDRAGMAALSDLEISTLIENLKDLPDGPC